ncbi:ribonuclease toxin immunity protein CdiI [Bacillus licheniformis]
MIYSDEYEQDEEEYFGQNKVLFYSGDGDDDYDIVSYDELYQYISAACNFYIEKILRRKSLLKNY